MTGSDQLTPRQRWDAAGRTHIDVHAIDLFTGALLIKIGFDVSQTGSGKAGCGYFADAMLEAMLEIAPANRYSLFPGFGDFYFDPMMPLSNPYSGQHVSYGPRHISRESAARFWTGGEGRQLMDSVDVVHANNFWCPVQVTSSRLIYTFYDMGFAVEPSWTTEANRRGCFDGVFRSAIAADWVVAISEASRDHYLRTFPGFPADRIRVIHPCSRFADANAVGRRPATLGEIASEGYWLNVGTIEPRKNQHRLAEAYAAYRRSSANPMPLVLAGGKGWLMEDFQAHLLELGITAHVVQTGYVSDDELIWLYRNCYANLYPSLFEGFGLPVLEGMQFGAPTVASDNTSIPEVAGDAAILLPADDVESWTRALLHLEMNLDERNRMGDAARARARAYDWKLNAASLLELYASAIASPKRFNI